MKEFWKSIKESLKELRADPVKRTIFNGISIAFLFSIILYLLFRHEEESFSAHLVAVFLELLLVMIVIEVAWREGERRHDELERQQQLRLIKSYMFHGHMFNLFWENFRAIGKDKDGITFSEIQKTDKFEDWKKLEGRCSHVIYTDPKSTAKAFMEYVKAEESVWKRFVELAVLFNFPQIIADMSEIQGCTARAKRIIPDIAKSLGETLPKELEGTLTEDGVALFLTKYSDLEGPDQKNLPTHEEQLARDIRLILRKGIMKFIEYAKELRGWKPDEIKKENGKPEQNSFELLMMPYVKKEQSLKEVGELYTSN